ncbi:cysteine-type endopeptidase/ ubiquitin thiolesterase [Zea mays]|uniref:Cysteine-type endopeptidase/ ubiquitin thiolesterase n=1 Tax=Zea mays TaxID=4577 RepID=A0A1D6JBA9_MAIZE|nr:cysteine-type endopeptidase/ ubiquitin thiolesterase [Zea mays]AQK45172.1 Cysteine-type endopeptidase/ ubiquitin thiolesterase [Zea mays]
MLPGGGGEEWKRRGAPAGEDAADADADAATSASAASLNDLCATAAAGAPAPFPTAAAWAVAALLAVGLGVGALVLAVVRSPALLVVAVLLAASVAAFLLWNAAAAASGHALRRFVDGLQASSLRVAADGQLVKITGFVSCGDISLISSYEKVENCVYTSTILRKCARWGSMTLNPWNRCSKWKLAHAERFAADFYVADAKSGRRALVKAGHHSKVVPLIDENLLVTTSRGTELSSTLEHWLEERNLSSEEAQIIRLEEGYIREGMRLSVVGVLSKKNGDAVILPPLEPQSTGFVLLSCLLPSYFDGIVLRLAAVPNSGVS